MSINNAPNPTFPQTKEAWEALMLEKYGPEVWNAEERARFNRDWPRFKTLL